MSSDGLGWRLHQLGIAILCAKVLLVPLVFDASSDVSFTLPKALLSHALAYALVGVLAALVVHSGPAVIVRSPLHFPVLAFGAANVVATVFAVDPYLALFGAHSRMLGLGTIADWIVLYFAVVVLARTGGDLVALASAAIGGSAVVLGYEAIQMLGRDPFVWTIDNGGRPFSALGQPTTLGVYLIVLTAAVGGAGLLAAGLRPWARVALLAWASLLLAGAAASGTRSILLGLGAAVAAVALLTWLRHPARRARIAAVGIAGSAFLVIAVLLLAMPLGVRLAGGLSDSSTQGRMDLYGIALRMVQERPILGYGPDTFAVGVPRYRPEAASPGVRQSLATSAHGWLPFVLTGSGIIGLAAFAAMLVTTIALTLRGPLSTPALVGAAMAAAFLGAGLTSIDDIGTDWLLWSGLGLVAAGTAPRAPSPEPPTGRASRRRRGPPGRRSESTGRRGLAIAVVAMGLIAVLSGSAALDASRSAMRSANVRLQGRAGEAVDAARAAVRSDPGRAEYWHALGFAYVAAQRFAEAADAFDRAVRIAPHDVTYWSDQIQTQFLLANRGDAAARARALKFADEAVRVDPNNPRIHITRAVALQATGDLERARAAIERALALDPASTNERLYVTAVQIMVAVGRADDAIRIARDGLGVLPSTVVALRVELVRSLVAAGRLDEALVEADLVLSIQPNLTTAQQLRAQLRAALGR